MKADPVDQRRLLDLQALDTALLQVAHKKQTLPVLQQIAALKAERATIGERFVAADTRAGDAERDLKRAESDLVPVKERLDRNQARVDAGQVPDAKALQSMLDEIAHLKHRISDLEDAQLEAMEQAESTAAERDRLKADVEGIDGKLRELIAERNQEAARLDAEATRQQENRQAVAAQLPADLVALYVKVAGRSGGVGAAQLLSGRRCSGCGLEANTADVVRYAAAPDDEVLRCEECDRILVRPEKQERM